MSSDNADPLIEGRRYPLINSSIDRCPKENRIYLLWHGGQVVEINAGDLSVYLRGAADKFSAEEFSFEPQIPDSKSMEQRLQQLRRLHDLDKKKLAIGF